VPATKREWDEAQVNEPVEITSTVKIVSTVVNGQLVEQTRYLCAPSTGADPQAIDAVEQFLAYRFGIGR
jgi:hypothetical protein